MKTLLAALAALAAVTGTASAGYHDHHNSHFVSTYSAPVVYVRHVWTPTYFVVRKFHGH